jgi:predicted naringenin-chalcone synthase
MKPVLLGWGTALPPHSISQPDASQAAARFCCESPEQQRMLSMLFHRAGVASRNSVVLDRSDGPVDQRQPFYADRALVGPHGPTTATRMQEFARHAGKLAVAAAERALAVAEVDASSITQLVTVTCSGFEAPGFDIDLIQKLPLSNGVNRTQLGFMGCHGALNALRVARAFVNADPRESVLVCCVELCSLHYQYQWQAELMVANSLFSDGAAALVVAHHDGARHSQPSPLARPAVQLVGSGSWVVPDTRDSMSWRIGDHGFQMGLSPRVPESIEHELRPWLTSWLSGYGVHIDQVAHWAVHPGGPRILSAVRNAMQFDDAVLQQSLSVLRDYGNMSSPTLVFILERIFAEPLKGPLVMLGFGPGLTIEAALLVPSTQ